MTMKLLHYVLPGLLSVSAAAQTPTPARINMLNPELTGTNQMTCTEAVPVDSGNNTPGSYAQQVLACNIVAAGLGYSYQMPSTGFSIAIPPYTRKLNLNPTSALATGTIVFPATAVDRWPTVIVSTQNVSAVTFKPTPGTTIVGAPAGLTANTPVRWQYTLSCTCYMPD
jgi:hypothetical protein